MIFSQDRDSLRKMYRDAWRKQQDRAPLSPLEAQIARVVEEHPEYQEAVESGASGADFTPEQGQTNPFLHMGMHLAIREQVATDRPAGIRLQFERLAKRHGALEAEHRMMEALGRALWEAQRSNSPPDEQAYLEHLKRL